MKHIENIANKVIEELDKQGIKSYIWHKATTNSVYIRFEDNRIGSIRLADHRGRERLKYKWNIFFNKCKEEWIKDETWRYFVQGQNWKNIIPQIVNRANQVKDWNNYKYYYTIPKFKQ